MLQLIFMFYRILFMSREDLFLNQRYSVYVTLRTL